MSRLVPAGGKTEHRVLESKTEPRAEHHHLPDPRNGGLCLCLCTILDHHDRLQPARCGDVLRTVCGAMSMGMNDGYEQ